MKTLLVVDDEKNIRTLYEKELTADGYKVILAQNGAEALEKVRTTPIDLVVLDIKMEGIDGLECLNLIMQENKNLPVILNTAYSTYKSDFSSWLADAYVIKSFNLDELKSKIRELLGEERK